jgi:hypothetical protein
MAGWLPNDQSIISRQPESGDERGQPDTEIQYICRQIIILRQQESREERGQPDTKIHMNTDECAVVVQDP